MTEYTTTWVASTHDSDNDISTVVAWPKSELVMGHFCKTQPNPQKSSTDPTQPIIDTRYGILGYTEHFIQQLLHVTDNFGWPSGADKARISMFFGFLFL